jgi:hypothetical protein
MSRAQWGGLAEILLTKKTTPGRELLTALAGRSACAASANRRWKRSVAASAGWLHEGTPVIEMGYSPTEFWGVSTGFESVGNAASKSLTGADLCLPNAFGASIAQVPRMRQQRFVQGGQYLRAVDSTKDLRHQRAGPARLTGCQARNKGRHRAGCSTRASGRRRRTGCGAESASG